MAMTDQVIQTPAATQQPERRRMVRYLVVGIVAFVFGALGGWMLRSDDGADDVIDVVAGDVSERQEEMLAIADAHRDAFRAGDGEALTSFYVPQGVLVAHEVSGSWMTVRVDDGTMAGILEGQAPPARMEAVGPALVFEDYALQTIDWGSGYGTMLHRFTTSGDVLIVNTQIVFAGT